MKHNTREEVDIEKKVDSFINGFLPTDRDEQLEDYSEEELEKETWSIRAYAVRNRLRTVLTTAAQEKEEAVAEVVERWRKSIDDEARSCSVKIEEAVNEGERKMLQRIRNRIVLAKPVLRTAEQQEVRTMFLHEVDVLAASLPPLKKTPPKNISSNETTV